MKEPRRICRECLRDVDPSDAGVVVAVDPTLHDVTGFSVSGVQELQQDQPVYFHRDHLWPGWVIVPRPADWD
jgi:hypothetical protein